jgi:hypothetical protein
MTCLLCAVFRDISHAGWSTLRHSVARKVLDIPRCDRPYGCREHPAASLPGALQVPRLPTGTSTS